MSHNNRKRKARGANRKPLPSEYQFLNHHQQPDSEESAQIALDPLQALYFEAYEADIVHAPGAEATAASLEVVGYHVAEDSSVKVVPKTGAALIPWGDNNPELDGSNQSSSAVGVRAWVDRYDARLLLDANEEILVEEYPQPPGSPSDWSDLPSDAEDMFFFAPDEIEDLHREKRRRILEKTREERLQARLKEDGVDDTPVTEDIWGGSDEEADDAQKELMQRTASHLLASPNPAQLEMRILTNHGADRRFAFLRGRWKRAWNLAKAKARQEKTAAENEARARAEAPKPVGLGSVAGYGSDSDADDGGSSANGAAGDVNNSTSAPDEPAAAPAHVIPVQTAPHHIADSGDSVKEARRKRLAEWTKSRRDQKDSNV